MHKHLMMPAIRYTGSIVQMLEDVGSTSAYHMRHFLDSGGFMAEFSGHSKASANS